ncbi:MAG: hypothetical protein KH024_19795 [Hungatella hathewayi]|uniref:Uncharacterized protein n=1 Tax=Hungatella hathewayi WAL-18680 TaxID=742737 RepID=G5INI2_9FIRM|nr:hypothetical protein [Hungatella hathewayi]EHI56856.1 hypothetical protein HMPREF9473_05060 [ [Hungatella hathewayi WAL-18680]MBS4986429.1 hypothetical protein [Hungatella hathewayi]
MSNYRRLISYIYAYEGGIKGKNIGFAKIEARNGQCKIQVSVKKVYVGNNDMGVYLLAGSDQILLGKIFIRNGAGEFRAVVSAGNVENSGWSMDQCYGLSIHSVEDSWQAYTTIWDDAVTQAAELQPGETVELDTVEHAAQLELDEVTSENVEVEHMAQIPDASISEETVNQMVMEHKSSIVEEIEAEIQAQSEADEQQAQEIQEAQEMKRAQEVQQMQRAQAMQRAQTMRQPEPNVEEMPAAEIPQPIMADQILRPNMEPSQTQAPVNQTPVNQTPVNQAPVNQTPVNQAPVNQTPVNQTPINQAPVNQAPVNQTPVNQTPVNQAPVNQTPVNPAPAGMENWEFFNRLEREERESGQPDRLWQHFRKTYPKIQAFDYANGCEILMVKPQDIGLLPRETWTYGNNSFLLHGYYSYRYLILVKLNNPEGNPRYLLGVPGHYYSNEKYMASMFGFPNFVLSKLQPAGDARFGYWYTDINMGNQ